MFFYLFILKDKLEKGAEALLKDPAKCNKLFQTVAYWLRLNENIIYKLLNQQCIVRMENEFNRKAKLAKENNENNDDDEDSPDEDLNDLIVNTSSIISYDDFKIGEFLLNSYFLKIISKV